MSPKPDLLEGLEAGQARDLMTLAVPVSLPPGQVLFRLGEEAARLYVIQAGLITLTMPLQIAGREEDVPIDERLPGQTVGWSTLIPPHRFTLTATATIATDLLAFSRDDLFRHFEREPRVGYVVARNIAALVGERFDVFQAMWLRQVQQMVNASHG